MKQNDAVEQMFEEVVSVDDNALLQVDESKRKPRITDPGWTDYILSLLSDDEKVVNKKNSKSFPKTEGLRRVSNTVLGKVLVTKPHVGNVIYTDKGLIVIALHELVIERSGGEGQLEAWGMSDAREEFLNHPFNKYVSANASTKAMGRAYRDALQLKVCVAEEVNDVQDLTGPEDPEDAQPITDAQKAGIATVCKKLGIDCRKFVSRGPFPSRSIDEVYVGTARKMMAALNGYQTGTPIPENILKEDK